MDLIMGDKVVTCDICGREYLVSDISDEIKHHCESCERELSDNKKNERFIENIGGR